MTEHQEKTERVILELTRGEIELIAATTHLFLITHPENPVANLLLKDLIGQTDYVRSDPKSHGVRTSPIIKPESAVTTQEHYGLLAGAMDISQLDHLYYIQ